MVDSPGTVSKILWHFTGGPIWDDKIKKQGTTLKPFAESYSALKSIIDSRELRVGSYHELVKVIIPQKRIFNIKTKMTEIKYNYPIEIHSSPVCCVADIPMQHLRYHSKRYGKIAIGFYRDSIVKNGFNPVMYTLENSILSNSVYDAYSAVDDVDPSSASSSLSDLESDIQTIYDDNGINESVDINDLEYDLNDIENGKDTIDNNFKTLIAFIKTFEVSEFDSIYCEREWRSTKQFNFSIDDIALVVLPKNADGENYYQQFINSTDLPRKIPITCWEDLIEH